VEYAVAEVPDEAGFFLLIGSHVLDGRAFDGVLGSAIEHLVVEQRPSSEWVGAYEQISMPAPSLRKRLFGMARASALDKARVATSCLSYIDDLRDKYGIASGEPRHPDIESGEPWPLVGDSASK
jgi:hypothetical protein